jgi:hypothetical protein
MPLRRLLAAGLLALPLAVQAGVQAQDYRAFWLWAGVRPQVLPADTRTLYLLQGEVLARHGQPARLHARQSGLPPLQVPEVWLVYRAETLDWPPLVHAQLNARLLRWRQSGRPLTGVQIDFDAPTRRLSDYAAFLAGLRRQLPADCRLGVTGLLDWSQADPADLNALAQVVDEVVLQTYQGRSTLADYQDYLARVQRLQLPFRIGLVQGGVWQPRHDPARSPHFRGYVVFLQNQRVSTQLP